MSPPRGRSTGPVAVEPGYGHGFGQRGEESVHKGQVHLADKARGLAGESLEWAVAEHESTLVLPWPETLVVQDVLSGGQRRCPRS